MLGSMNVVSYKPEGVKVKKSYEVDNLVKPFEDAGGL